MQPPHSTFDGLTGWQARLWKAAWPTGLVLGLGAEWLARSGQSLPAAGADLATGWTLIACGLLIWSRRPPGSVGLLLTLTGLAWFLGTLARSQAGSVAAAVGSALVVLHRGPLCHAIIGYPAGRRLGRMPTVVLVLCYMYAVTIPLAGNDAVTLGVAVLVVAATAYEYAQAVGPDRSARATAVAAAVLLAIPLVGGSLVRLMGAAGSDRTLVLLVYQAVLVVIAVGFLADFSLGRWAQAAVTKLVIDLGGEAETGTLQARLAHALGDRSLTIGYWLPEANGYVDDQGNPVELPAAGSGKAVTVVEHQGDRIAALVHDATVLNDPGLVDSVALAARIALSTVRLQADVQRQVAELDSSRLRILEAGDAQRRKLQQRLEAGAGQRLAHVRQLLDLAAREAETLPDDTAAKGLQTAQRDLAEAQADLQELAAGIHPAMLTQRGLGPALASLAKRAPVPVRLAATEERLPAVIESAVYFVCAEALANVAKHSRATRAEIHVRTEDGTVTVLIADDGVGGANPAAGSGLNGAGDRIGALGGRLTVHSPSGGGTRLLAEIPATNSLPGAVVPPVLTSS